MEYQDNLTYCDDALPHCEGAEPPPDLVETVQVSVRVRSVSRNLLEERVEAESVGAVLQHLDWSEPAGDERLGETVSLSKSLD